jgi:hypothetical protein
MIASFYVSIGKLGRVGPCRRSYPFPSSIGSLSAGARQAQAKVSRLRVPAEIADCGLWIS